MKGQRFHAARIGSICVGILGPAIYQHKPNDQIRVTWVDATGTHTAAVRLISGPAV